MYLIRKHNVVIQHMPEVGVIDGPQVINVAAGECEGMTDA